VSAAGVLVVAIDGAEPVAIALWRTTIVALLLAPAWLRAPPSGADRLRVALAGVALAGHFWAWFEALQHTSVLRATLLVTLAPAWAGLIERVMFGVRPRARFWPGVGVALAGVAVMGGGGGQAGRSGDALAVLGGVLGATYFVAGRRARANVGIASYAGAVCAMAALVLLAVSLATGTALAGWATRDWGLIAALALGPQLLGHNGFNWALRHWPAARVSAVTLLEPVGATLLAWAWLGQVPTAQSVAGGALVLLGVALAMV
jgi:drug/metabolite transporter (DMT)-like permease